MNPAKRMSAEHQLCWAAANGDLKRMQHLLRQGVDPDSVMDNGFDNRMPALLWAFCAERPDAVLLLLQHGANPRIRDSGGTTSLMMAVFSHPYLELIQWLINQGCDIQAANSEGRTALMEASASTHVDIIRALLEQGADLHARDKYGRTALLHALDPWSCCSSEMIRLLLKHGANPNDTDEINGQTALMRAVCGYSLDIVQLLVEHGASSTAKDHQGKTALELLEDKTPNDCDSTSKIRTYLTNKIRPRPKILSSLTKNANKITLPRKKSLKRSMTGL